MKNYRLLFFIFLLCTCVNTTSAHTLSLDSLSQMIKKQGEMIKDQLEIGSLDLEAYTISTSHCYRKGIAGRLIPQFLPFNCNLNQDLAVEAFSHVQYQWPGEMRCNVRSFHSNQGKKGLTIMNEIFQGLLPIYAMQRRNDYGSNKSYVLPFYDEGLKEYTYNFIDLTDSILIEAQNHGIDVDFSHVCCIAYHPIRQHHSLLDGYVLVDSVNSQILGLKWKGKLDFAKFIGQLYFTPDSANNDVLLPKYSEVTIDYTYARTKARNSYHTIFQNIEATPFAQINKDSIPHDLTPYYIEEEAEEADLTNHRPLYLPESVDSLFNLAPEAEILTPIQRGKAKIESFSEALIDGTRKGPEENRLRIYGPLDPASLGYDKFNGFTIREKARWTHKYGKGKDFFVLGEIGYAFRLQELRYRGLFEWNYFPSKRGRWRFELLKSDAGFSSKFIEAVDEELKKDSKGIKFDSLGIEYYQQHEISLEYGIEAANGLMVYGGLLNHFRTPVREGIRSKYISEERRRELVDTYYADFAPYIRLEWTPNQYYWYNNGYKEYIHSPGPTLRLEIAKAVKGAFNSDSDYGRVELDASQSFHIGRTRVMAYRIGAGKFFNRKGEYFINYRYFSRSEYPTSWEDDRIGGTFHLLDDPWYSASTEYVQAHFMHETPFGLLHHIRPISKYIIKERIYVGNLVAEGKPIYNEIGYGIMNNYFNVGFFVGFKGVEFYDIGLKFRLEIGNHL